MGKKVTKTSQRSSSRVSPKAKKAAPPAKTITKKTARATKVKAVPKKVVKRVAIKKVAAVPIKKAAPKKEISKKEAKPKRAATKKAAPSGPKGYTPDEYAKFKEFKAKFQKLSNQDLKDLLRKNLQSMTGNKDELIYKCADGATLGKIPRCPNCFGGRPKFDHQKGTYYCSGYRDDTDFHNCHSTFGKGDLTRDPWDN